MRRNNDNSPLYLGEIRENLVKTFVRVKDIKYPIHERNMHTVAVVPPATRHDTDGKVVRKF